MVIVVCGPVGARCEVEGRGGVAEGGVERLLGLVRGVELYVWWEAGLTLMLELWRAPESQCRRVVDDVICVSIRLCPSWRRVIATLGLREMWKV